jgi:hypothetical protein
LKHYLGNICSPVRIERHNFDDYAAAEQEFSRLNLVY